MYYRLKVLLFPIIYTILSKKMRKSKKEKVEAKRRELMICIDFLERSQNKEYSIKGYDKTADTIKELNRQLKDLNKK